MTLNDLECPIQLKVRLVDGTLDVRLLRVTHRCSQRARRESGLEDLAPSMWAADALFLCGSWASCYRFIWSVLANPTARSEIGYWYDNVVVVCPSVCLSVTLCIVAKRHILQQKCLNKRIGSIPRNTTFQLSPTLSCETLLLLNHKRWCHLANKLWLTDSAFCLIF